MSWLDGFLAAYKTIFANGVELPQREKLNFTNATVVDDPANERTNVTVTALTTPTGTGFVHVTGGVVDGAASNVSLTSQVTGDLPLANLANGTAGQVLFTNAAGNAPEWVTCHVDITADAGDPGAMFVTSITGTSSSCQIACDSLVFASDVTNATIKQDPTSASAGSPMSIRAANAIDNGSDLILASGDSTALSNTTGALYLRVGDTNLISGVLNYFTNTVSCTMYAPIVNWPAANLIGSGVTLKQNDAATDDPASDFVIQAGGAWTGASTNVDGKAAVIRGGNAKTPGTTGLRGGVRLEFRPESGTTKPMVEVAEVGVNRRVVALCQVSGTGVTSTEVPGSGSDGVVFIFNKQAAPGGNPVGGYLLYADGGALKGLGASGTTTTIGPAEPHCPVCGTDFGHEWTSEKFGSLQVCMSCLAEELGDRPWIRRVR